MISLRELRPDDAPSLQRVYSEPSVRHLPRPAMTSASAAAWLTAHAAQQRALPRVLYCFGIDDTEDLIGVVKLRSDGTTAALSYILRPDAWGHGHATTAVTLMLGYAATVLRLTSVTAKHHPDNHASARVLAKTGFTRTARSTTAVTYIRPL
ncbi:GNAT family N-acetyltransferase [Streptomyces roseirectus]|uniref:GNAT family N-acetyltransferase n=1 Tax=Streptomyces roseirectus TaxID=2768066 RepID=A0A7H0IFJ8_9ACTN|nr:GNAT family N-acetyltransferase [Streptomyces roseirectus]QNP71564.1 GNAT family N-acetyltransferase [Streptomyces roseirectus]